jgi:hypothetical protein
MTAEDSSLDPLPEGEALHLWVHENLAAFLAGGLSARERAHLEGHVHDCAACFDAFSDARGADLHAVRMLGALAPAEMDLEDLEARVAKHFRGATSRRLAAVRWAGMGVAAAVGLAATGVLANRLVHQDRLNNPVTLRLAAEVPGMPAWVQGSFGGESGAAATAAIPGERPLASAGADGVYDEMMRGTGLADSLKGKNDTVVEGVDALAERNGQLVRNGSTGWVGSGAVHLRAGTPDPVAVNEQLRQEEVAGLAAPAAAGGGPYNREIAKTPPPALALGMANDNITTPTMTSPYDYVMVPVANVSGGDRDERGAGQRDARMQSNQPAGRSAPIAQAGTAGPSPATQPAGASSPAVDTAVAERKVIRNGTVEFEVRSFDDAYNVIASVTHEEGGFVSSTSSDRLTNGKIRGSVVVRVPPEHLDRLLLKLRGIGDLKNQQISASDVTKQYTDMESELRGLRAMESRMIDLIKNGKGEVKDLVEAEKQLGEYRVRIEKLEGEIRYYNNLVAMATLTITAYEKDIQKAAAAVEQETGTIDVQTEEIEARFSEARKIIDEAKGRVIDSNARKGDNDQATAYLVAEVPAEKADGVMANLRALGTVVRFERSRKQTVTGGSDGAAAGLAVEQKESRISLTLSNLASVPPRETRSVNLAANDVGAAYQAILALVRDSGGAATRPAAAPGVMSAVGRVATSQLSGNRPEDMTANIQAEVRSEAVDKMISTLRAQGVIVATTVSQSANGSATSAKEGFSIQIVSAATVPPRDTMVVRVAAADVAAVHEAVLAAMREGEAAATAGRVTNSQLNGRTPTEMNSAIQAEVRIEALPRILTLLREQGAILSQTVTHNASGVGTETKEGLSLTVVSAATLPPRRVTTLGVEVSDVTRGMERIRGALPANARILEDLAGRESSGRTNGRITVEVPIADVMRVLTAVRDLNGEERVNSVQTNPDTPDTRYATERISVTLSSRGGIVEPDKGVGTTVRAALSSALAALSWSLYLVLTGVLFLLPWGLVLWVIRRVWRRRRVAAA